MIAGFNTDIEYNGTVYHVQTEDKGAPQRMILSLVYDKGTILASKRTTYEQISDGDVDEKLLTEKVSWQHKLMCAAVKAGRISELVDMTRRAPTAPTHISPSGLPIAPVVAEGAAVALPAAPAAVAQIDIPSALPSLSVEFKPPVVDELPIVEAVEVIEDLEILPADAVAVLSELSGRDRAQHDRLTLELIGEVKLKGGDRKTLTVMLCSGSGRRVVSGAQIMVKVLGSAFRPVIFHARSDVNGLAKVHLQLPHFSAGRAALMVRAISDGEEVELRRLVRPG